MCLSFIFFSQNVLSKLNFAHILLNFHSYHRSRIKGTSKYEIIPLNNCWEQCWIILRNSINSYCVLLKYPIVMIYLSLQITISWFLLELQVPVPVGERGRKFLLIQSNNFVVEPRELQCPEYCFKIPFNCVQHPRFNANIHKLAAVIKGLGNSVGGVVILCREPGQRDHVELGDFVERLKIWIFGIDFISLADMLQFVDLPENKAVWGLILVKAYLPTGLSAPANIDESGFLLYNGATTVVSSDAKSNTMCSSSPHAATLSHKKISVPMAITQPVHTMTASEIEQQLGGKVSWTTHKRNWQQHVALDDDYDFESNVRKYATSSTIFVPSDPIVFSPSHMLKNLIGNPAERTRLIETIRAKLDSPRAFAIVVPSWLSLIGKGGFTKRPKNHVGDILLVTEQGSVYLWTIVQSIDTDADLQITYVVMAGRLTKLLLLKDQKEKCALRVDCYLYNLQDGTIEEPQLQQYTKSFLVNNIELKFVQETLAEIIAGKETYLRNVTGEVCGYKLSAEQWQIAEKATCAPVMVVSGPPGSGKTLLCAHFLQEKGQKSQSMYVCTNDALAEFMESQNICSVVVIRTDKQLRAMIQQGAFNNKTCITFDDVHRLSCSDHTAKQLLSLIKLNRDVRLYIFCDNKFQCFDEIRNPFASVVMQCCKRMDIDCTPYPLTEIHRNTRRIMSFLSAVSFKREIKCLNKWEGDDVEVLAAENPLGDSPDNQLIQNILQELGFQHSRSSRVHYAPHDIAVLIDTDSSNEDVWQCCQTIKKHVSGVEVHSAATFPRTGIVVDCLDAFHGLDAGVCLYVLSSTRIKKRDRFHRRIHRSIYNAKYLAFLASRAIHKAVFFLPRLDAKVFKEMLFDCFEKKASNFRC